MGASRSTLISIQCLRAAAAWSVVLHHFSQVFFKFKGDDWFNVFFSQYGARGIDLFFVISGFVMYKSTSEKHVSPHQFMFNRIVRIVPIYWVFTFAFLALIWLSPQVPQAESYDLGFLLKSLFFIPVENPRGIGLFPLLTVGWTLNLEMAFYVVFAVSLFAGGAYRLAAVTLGILLLQNVVPLLSSDFRIFGRQVSFEFLLGVGVGILYERKLLRLSVAVCLILSAGALLAMSFAHKSQDYLLVGIPFSVVLAAAISQEERFKRHKWIAAVGDWSYSTYLSHVIILYIFFIASQNWGIGPWMMLVPCCAAILLVSWASYVYLEQRMTRALKRIWPSKRKLVTAHQ